MVERGDCVAIWQTRDSNGERGIVALGRVIGEAATANDRDNPFWVNSDEARAESVRVPVRYHRLSAPFWIDDTDVGADSYNLCRSQEQEEAPCFG